MVSPDEEIPPISMKNHVPEATTIHYVVNTDDNENHDGQCCGLCGDICCKCMGKTCTCCGLTTIYVGFGIWTIIAGLLIFALSTAAFGLFITIVGIPLAALAVYGLGISWLWCGKKLCKK